MSTRYSIKSRRAVLSSTILTKPLAQSYSCAIVETSVVNLSPAVIARNPKKIISFYDEETETVSLFSHGNTNGESRKIFLSSKKLEGVARYIQDYGLSMFISCLSANSVFFSGAKPPDRSRFIYCYQPRHGLNKICKRRLAIVESVGLSFSEQKTSVQIRRMLNIGSGCLFKLDLVGRVREGEGTVAFNYNGRDYTLKARFGEALDGLEHPLSEAVLELMKYGNMCASVGEVLAIERFCAYAGSHLSSNVIWKIIQKAAVLGEISLLQSLIIILASRLNPVVQDGIVGVEVELGLEL